SSGYPASSHIKVASRHERSCDSSGWPNALSCASASVATSSPRRSGGESEMGRPPDVLERAVGQHRLTTCRCPSPRATNTKARRIVMASQPNGSAATIRVGLVADQTGPLGPAGLADANVVRMVVGDINAKGGLLGRKIELHIEDGATDDAVASAKAEKLVNEHRVDLILGGILSSTRQAIKRPAVTEGKTLYIYPEQYEGQESDPLIFCTGPVPAQQVDPFIPWLMRETGARTFYLPSADYIWPHVLNARVRDVVTANGGAIVGEEYFPLDHTDYRRTAENTAAR